AAVLEEERVALPARGEPRADREARRDRALVLEDRALDLVRAELEPEREPPRGRPRRDAVADGRRRGSGAEAVLVERAARTGGALRAQSARDGDGLLGARSARDVHGRIVVVSAARAVPPPAPSAAVRRLRVRGLGPGRRRRVELEARRERARREVE